MSIYTIYKSKTIPDARNYSGVTTRYVEWKVHAYSVRDARALSKLRYKSYKLYMVRKDAI